MSVVKSGDICVRVYCCRRFIIFGCTDVMELNVEEFGSGVGDGRLDGLYGMNI